MNLYDTLDRRRVLAGALGAGLVATAGVGIAGAQDESATPAATEAATPAAGAGGLQDDDDAAAAAAIERVTAAIDSAQADRDAVAAQIDPTTIDQLLAQATTLRDRAQTAAGAGDAAEARRLVRAAAATAGAAGELVEAQLIAAGLPSQEAPASRVLADAYEAIQSASEATATTTDADGGFYVATAQTLYQSAYDLYGAGGFGQAARTARVAVRLAAIAEFLTAADDDGFGGERGRGRRGGLDGRGGGDRAPDADQDEPVPVPEPSF